MVLPNYLLNFYLANNLVKTMSEKKYHIEGVEYALQEASKSLASQDPSEIQRGLGWAIYALARQGIEEAEEKQSPQYSCKDCEEDTQLCGDCRGKLVKT